MNREEFVRQNQQKNDTIISLKAEVGALRELLAAARGSLLACREARDGACLRRLGIKLHRVRADCKSGECVGNRR